MTRKQRAKSISNLSPDPRYYQVQTAESTVSPAPFGCSSKRFPQQHLVKKPNPGSYNIVENINDNKLIYECGQDNQQITVFEYPKSTSNFKSMSKRFASPHSSLNPGPGSYFGKKVKLRSNPKTNQLAKPNTLMKYISECRHDQKCRHSLYELVNVNEKIPRYNQQFQYSKPAGSAKKTQHFFSSSAPRIRYERPMTSIGPGQYQIDRVSPQRTPNANKIISLKHKKNKNEAKKSQEQSQIKIESAFYFSEQISRSLSKVHKKLSQSIECFGSTASRFPSHASEFDNNCEPGPGFYKIYCESDKKTNHSQKTAPIAFQSTQPRYFNLHTSQNQVAPGSYQCKNEFSKLVSEKYKGGLKVSFGSKLERPMILSLQKKNSQQVTVRQKIDLSMFPTRTQENSNKQMVNCLKIESSSKRNTKNQNTLRPKTKSSSKDNLQSMQHKNQAIKELRPLCYDTTYKTIQKSLEINCEHHKDRKKTQDWYNVPKNRKTKHIKQRISQSKLRTHTHISYQSPCESLGELKMLDSKNLKQNQFQVRMPIKNTMKFSKIRQITQQMKKVRKGVWSMASQTPRVLFKKDQLSDVCPGKYEIGIPIKKSFRKLQLR